MQLLFYLVYGNLLVQNCYFFSSLFDTTPTLCKILVIYKNLIFFPNAELLLHFYYSIKWMKNASCFQYSLVRITVLLVCKMPWLYAKSLITQYACDIYLKNVQNFKQELWSKIFVNLGGYLHNFSFRFRSVISQKLITYYKNILPL